MRKCLGDHRCPEQPPRQATFPQSAGTALLGCHACSIPTDGVLARLSRAREPARGCACARRRGPDRHHVVVRKLLGYAARYASLGRESAGNHREADLRATQRLASRSRSGTRKSRRRCCGANPTQSTTSPSLRPEPSVCPREYTIILGLTSCPTIAELPAELSPQALAKRVEAGTDVLLVVPPSATETWRDYAREFEIDFDDREQFVADHFSFDPELDSGSHTVLTVPVGSIPSPFVSAATRSGPAVVYRGAGHAAGLHPLLTTLLKAPTTAISAASGSDAPTDEARLAGQQLALVSAFQARNNARVTFSGSADLFSDEFLEPPTVSSAK